MVTLVAIHGKWIAYTPEGFFVASSDWAELILFVRDEEVLATDRADGLNRPDLVQEKLAGDPNGKVPLAAAHGLHLTIRRMSVAEFLYQKKRAMPANPSGIAGVDLADSHGVHGLVDGGQHRQHRHAVDHRRGNWSRLVFRNALVHAVVVKVDRAPERNVSLDAQR